MNHLMFQPIYRHPGQRLFGFATRQQDKTHLYAVAAAYAIYQGQTIYGNVIEVLTDELLLKEMSSCAHLNIEAVAVADPP